MKKTLLTLAALLGCCVALEFTAPAQVQVQPEYLLNYTNRYKVGYTPLEYYSDINRWTNATGTNTRAPEVPYFKQKDLWVEWKATWTHFSEGQPVIEYTGTNAFHLTTRRDPPSGSDVCTDKVGSYVFNYPNPANDFAGAASCTEWTTRYLTGGDGPYGSDGILDGDPDNHIWEAGGWWWDFWGNGLEHDPDHWYRCWWPLPTLTCTNSLTQIYFTAVQPTATPDNRGAVTNTRYLLLSDEFTTKELLGLFVQRDFTESDWSLGYWPNQAWTTLSTDQSQTVLQGARMRFKMKIPRGQTNIVPYQVRVHLDGFTNDTVTVPPRDIYTNGSFLCLGTGADDYYPTAKPLVLEPPCSRILIGNSTNYVGGTADISLLDFHHFDDGMDKGSSSQSCCACSGPGMPTWWVTEPFINLWAADTPVQYTTSLGQKLGFSMSYSQRDTRPTTINGTNAFVPPTGWNHNWFSYVHFAGEATYDEGMADFTNKTFEHWTATVYAPGGGETPFAYNQTSDSTSGDKLFPLDGVNSHVYPASNEVTNGGPNLYGAVGFRLVHPDGSQDIYGTVTPLYPMIYTNIVPLVQDSADTQVPDTIWTLGRGSVPGPAAPYAPYRAAEVAAYTNGVGTPGLVLRTNWAQLVNDSTNNFGPVQIRGPLCADAVLTEHIDPFGNTVHLYYFGTSDALRLEGPLRLQSIVDYDGNPTYFSYSNGCISRVTMPYERIATFTSNTNRQLLSVTDAAQMTSSFGYDGQGYLGAITTPYGGTYFTHFETNQSGLYDPSNGVSRAMLISNPDGSHELYAFFDRAPNSAPTSFSGNDLPGFLNGESWPLDTGCLTNETGAMYVRNSFHWGPAQFERLSNTGFSPEALNQLQPADFSLARMSHWMLEADGLTISSAVSMSQEPSPDGISSGLRTWYCYGNYVPWQLDHGVSSRPLVRVRLQPDGTPWYQLLTYDPWPPSLLYDITTVFVPPGGGVTSREYSFGHQSQTYLSFGYTATSYTNGTQAGTQSWTGYLPGGFSGPSTFLSVEASEQTVSVDQTGTGPDGVDCRFNTTYPRYPEIITTRDDYVSYHTYYNGRQQLSGAWLPSPSYDGLTITNLFDAGGFLSKTIALETQTTNSYSFYHGLLQSRTDPLGLSTSYTWDSLERLRTVSFPDSTTVENVYTNLDLCAQKDRLGHWSYAVFDSMRRLKLLQDRSGNQTVLGYCTCGGLDSVTDPMNNATLFDRDLLGRVTNTVFGDQGSRALRLDSLGRPVTITDGSGATVNCFYDNAGRLIRAMGPEGQIFGAGYDYAAQENLPNWVTNADGIVVTNHYGNYDSLSGRDYPNGMSQSWSYSQGRVTATRDAANRETDYAYDAAGRVSSIEDPSQHTVGFAYGRAGELLSLTNENGAVTRWAYDIYGRAIAKTNANGLCVETNGFDANGRLIAHWSPSKGRTTYDYDNNGNLTSIHYPNSTINYGYDALNRVVAVGDAAGGSTFSYQNFGAFSSALATEVGPWGESVSRGYQQGLLRSLWLGGWGQSYFYDNAQRLSAIGSPAGTFNYNYNGAGSQIAGLSLPGGSTIGYAYDPAGLLTSTALTNGLGQLLDSAAYTYDLSGLRTNVLRDSGVNVAYAYDPAGQLTGALGYEPSGALRHNENFAYEYDPAGNLTNRINDCLAQAFRTDPANQLTNISRLVDLITEAGSLTNVPWRLEVNGAWAITNRDLTFAAPNLPLLDGLNYFTNILKTNSALSAWFTNVLSKNLPASVKLAYDLNGNMISDGLHGYTYDDANQLVTITVTNVSQSVFVYDGFGRRRIRREYVWVSALGSWQVTNEVRYVYDGMLAIQERDSNNVARVSYTRGIDLSGGLQGAGGIGGLLARTDGGGSAYYHADGAGNITAMVNGQGSAMAKYLYDPFGNALGKWGPLADANLYRFSSKEVHGPSGLYYYGFRFYDPNLQRWPNQDPIAEAGGINVHRYARNSPISMCDPLGLEENVMSAFPSGGPAQYWNNDFMGAPMPGPGGHGPGYLWRPSSRPPMTFADFMDKVYKPIAERVIPGQLAWDNATDEFSKGNYLEGAGYVSRMIAEQAAFFAGGAGGSGGGRCAMAPMTAGERQAIIAEVNAQERALQQTLETALKYREAALDTLNAAERSLQEVEGMFDKVIDNLHVVMRAGFNSAAYKESQELFDLAQTVLEVAKRRLTRAYDAWRQANAAAIKVRP